MSDSPKSVLEGVDAVIDSHFFSGEQSPGYQYHHKRSWNALSKNPPKGFDGSALIDAMGSRIEENLKIRSNCAPSQDNWSLRSTKHQHLIETARENDSDEVTLERAIVQRWPKDWTYQMPVASGLFGSRTDKRRAVDLVFDHKNGHYEFVELKIKSDTPLHAAMEILKYGLVYLASRKDRAENLAYDGAVLPILRASRITLCVLAPQRYYGDRDVAWLEDSINEGLKRSAVPGLSIDFRFEQFKFPWDSDSSPNDLPETLGRQPVCR